MAVLAMERIHLVALRRDSKLIMELLQRRGAVDVSDAGEEDEVFQKTDTTAVRLLLDKNRETTEQAVEVLNKAVPAKGGGIAFLNGRDAVSLAASDDFDERRDELLRVAKRIAALQREIAEARGEIARAEAGAEALVPWMDLPVPQTFSGTKKVAVFIGVLEGEHTLEGIYQSLAGVAPDLDPVNVEIVWGGKSQTCLMVMAPKRLAQRAEEALRAIGFSRPPSASHHMPAEKLRRLEEQKETAQAAIDKANAEIEGYAEHRQDLKYLQDNLAMRAERYEVLEKTIISKHAMILTGYVPAGIARQLKDELVQKFQCEVELTPAEEPGGEVPVKIKNPWFTEPVESVLEAYSLPGKGEVDPTSVMAIFYYIMFGLMFSDAGYGLIMFGACLFCLLKFKNMEPNWNKNVRLFMWCGLSTVFWGVIFSSYFGDVVDVVSRTFFGHQVSIPPVWFLPMEDPMLLLVFCLGIGIVHLTVGYIMKGVTCAKNGDYMGVLWDSVTPIVAWYPLVIILMGSEMFEGMAGFRLNLPASATPVLLGVTGVAVVITILTAGRESRNWGKRLLKGLYGVYNLLSGWLSDVLSYSRLLALGLATGVIASVMNQLGSLVGNGFIGMIVFILVFAVGQTLNFGINVLGAYVHSNRLEYVEFFGKFYDGGGRKFSPFGMHTKYYKIVEED